MTVELTETCDGKVLFVRASGKLTREDYHHLVPEFERLITKHGRIRVLFDMHDFHGWKAGALWEDIKFDLKHFKDIERVAMVGETTWEKWMATFCRPFTTAAIRYFDRSEADEARKWIEETQTVNTSYSTTHQPPSPRGDAGYRHRRWILDRNVRDGRQGRPRSCLAANRPDTATSPRLPSNDQTRCIVVTGYHV